MITLRIIAAVLLVALLLAGCVIIAGTTLALLELLRDIWHKDNTEK